MSYSDIMTVRPEVLSRGGLEGIIDIQNLLDGNSAAIETNAELFFDMTYPTSDIRLVVDNLNRRFENPEQAAGLFLLEGYKGSGKSHLALLVYHLMKNYSAAQKWLAHFNIALRVPENIEVHVFKFTDSPIQTSLWEILFGKLGYSGPELDRPPSLDLWRKLINNRQIVLIFDELERGMASLPTEVQNQNLSFLQMITEESNRTKEATCTIVASIYDSQREPGSTLRRIPCIEVKFSQPLDRQNIVLHRLFAHLPTEHRKQIEPTLHSFANYWRSHNIRVDEKYTERAMSTFPFSPELMDLVLFHIPARGGFQGNRSALGFLGALVKHTWRKSDWISMAHATLTDTSIRNRISDLDPSQRIMQCAQSDLHDLSELAFSGEIIACALLGTLANSGHLPGVDEQELARQVLSPGDDINQYHSALQALLKLGTYFQVHEQKYHFDEREKPGAKVEYHSLRIDPDRAMEFALSRWKEELFDFPKAILHRDISRTRSELSNLDSHNLRFIFSPKRLDNSERSNIFRGLENQNQIILLEPKQDSFDVFNQPDILKWAQRALAARELQTSANESERKRQYDKIEKEDTAYILQTIKQAGLVFVWPQLNEEKGGITGYELESMPGAEKRADVERYLREQLFPRQILEEHIEAHLGILINKTMRQIEAIYCKSLGFPIIVSQSIFYDAINKLCTNKKIGVVHPKDNACGRRPNLRSDELLDALIVEPFEDRKVPSLVDSIPVGETPEYFPPSAEQLEQIEQAQPIEQTQTRTKLQTPFTRSLSQLRQEVASRLLEFAEKQITEVEFRLFVEHSSTDLSQFTQAIRGTVSGLGDISVDITLRKKGPFSKSQIEQMVESLPVYQDAQYKAEMFVIE